MGTCHYVCLSFGFFSVAPRLVLLMMPCLAFRREETRLTAVIQPTSITELPIAPAPLPDTNVLSTDHGRNVYCPPDSGLLLVLQRAPLRWMKDPQLRAKKLSKAQG